MPPSGSGSVASLPLGHRLLTDDFVPSERSLAWGFIRTHGPRWPNRFAIVVIDDFVVVAVGLACALLLEFNLPKEKPRRTGPCGWLDGVLSPGMSVPR